MHQAVTGVLFSFLPNTVLSILLMLTNIIATITLYMLLRQLYNSFPALSIKNIYGVLPTSIVTDNDDIIVKGQNYDPSSEHIITHNPLLPTHEPSTITSITKQYNKNKSYIHINNHDDDIYNDNANTNNDEVVVDFTTHKNTNMDDIHKQLNSSFSNDPIDIHTPTIYTSYYNTYIKPFMTSGCVGVMVSFAMLYFTVLRYV